MSATRQGDPLLVLTVVVVAIAARLLPLHLSPLPFNTDGFVYVRRAEQILGSNAVAFTGPTAPFPDEYLFDTLLAMVSEVVGVPPLYVLQILIACLAVVPLLVAISYVRLLMQSQTRSNTRLAAAFVGLGLSVEGLYLWRTATASSEVYGLVFIAVIVLALHRALLTGQSRWMGLTVGLSILMPVVHNGSTFVIGLIGTVIVALAIGRNFTIRRAVLGGIGVVGFWLVAFGYYNVVELPNSATISAAPGLFIGWTILVVALARWLDTTSASLQRTVSLGVFGIGVCVFVLNAVLPVFPGMPSTSLSLCSSIRFRSRSCS